MTEEVLVHPQVLELMEVLKKKTKVELLQRASTQPDFNKTRHAYYSKSDLIVFLIQQTLYQQKVPFFLSRQQRKRLGIQKTVLDDDASSLFSVRVHQPQPQQQQTAPVSFQVSVQQQQQQREQEEGEPEEEELLEKVIGFSNENDFYFTKNEDIDLKK